MSIYRRVLRYYRPFLGQTILGLVLSLFGIGLNLLKPWPFKIIVDNFLRTGPAIHNKGFTNIFGSAITLVGTFVIMVQLDWQLTLLSLGIVPLIVGTIYIFAHRIRRESTSIQEQESAVLTQAQEGLSSIRMVHAFGREEFEVRQFHHQARQS